MAMAMKAIEHEHRAGNELEPGIQEYDRRDQQRTRGHPLEDANQVGKGRESPDPAMSAHGHQADALHNDDDRQEMLGLNQEHIGDAAEHIEADPVCTDPGNGDDGEIVEQDPPSIADRLEVLENGAEELHQLLPHCCRASRFLTRSMAPSSTSRDKTSHSPRGPFRPISSDASTLIIMDSNNTMTVTDECAIPLRVARW